MRHVHPTAVVDARAEIADGVEIGAFAVIGPSVAVGRKTRIWPHATVLGPTRVGDHNEIHPFAVLGAAPQTRGKGDEATLLLGNRNVVREHVTIHRGTTGPTQIGDECLFMVGSHVAHDSQVGSHVTLSNAVQLAGHVVVEDHATLGGLAGVAQYVRIGERAFVAGGAMCERDAPPFVIVQGDRAKVRALNVVGLERSGVPKESIEALGKAFRVLFGGHSMREVLRTTLDRSDPYVARLAAALERPPMRPPPR